MSDSAFIKWWIKEGADEWARLIDISGSALYPWQMIFEAGRKHSEERIATLEKELADYKAQRKTLCTECRSTIGIGKDGLIEFVPKEQGDE